MNIKERISALRQAMKEAGIDAYLVPSDDDHASEYVNDHFKCREWITGFTGSAGTALITADEAFLWTDGRYFLQAAEQLQGSGVTLMKMGEPGVPTIKEKLQALAAAAGAHTSDDQNLAAQDADAASVYVLGFDGSTMTASGGEGFEKDCPVKIKYDQDLIGGIWSDRPALDPTDIWEFPLTSCGKTFEEKLSDVRFEMSASGADVLLVSDLMETAWLFNLRAADVYDTPVFYSYAIITMYECCLFTLPGAISDSLASKLASLGIILKNYDETSSVLNNIMKNGSASAEPDSSCGSPAIKAEPDSNCSCGTAAKNTICGNAIGDTPVLWADRTKTPYSLIRGLGRVIDLNCGDQNRGQDATESGSSFVQMIDKPTPIEMMKAIKNETEIAATEHAHLKDGVAVSKFIYWLKQQMQRSSCSLCGCGAQDSADNAGSQNDDRALRITELSASDKLEALRREQEGCFDLSFPTIAGYMSNGAIIHYEPTPESDTEVRADGVLLVDSGGQYIDGTTDITRTIAVGPLTDKIREYYTLVLKGHIDLAMARFPRGTTGKELDQLTRRPLTRRGLDYNHGTGHGVGHVLSVHEGPNYISKRDGGQQILPGMITSDEPGIYIEGEFGIRIESEILCVKAEDQPDAVYQDLVRVSEDRAPADSAAGAGSEDRAPADGAAGAGSEDRAPADGAAGAGSDDLLAFKDITLAPLERDAIIPEMLTEKELSWLNSYHERVYSSVSPFLTEDEAAWLRDVTLPL